MSDDIAIKVEHLSKNFRLPHEKVTSIKGAFINFARRKRGYEIQHVLDDVSFEVKKGEFFGIVGRNGSGKSTLLKLLAGIYTPTAGTININGKLTPFIELGVGFNPELTGRENIFLNGALLGFNRKEVEKMFDDIVSFAELERFIDQKLKNYSSGMHVRLAFSIAIRARNEILLLDEVLAVGDAIFQKKCFKYFHELKKEKKTVVFISHDPNAVLEYCDRGILIEKGKIVSNGPIAKVINDYTDMLNGIEERQSLNEVPGRQGKRRWGTGTAVVDEVLALDSKGVHKTVYADEDKHVIIQVTYRSKADVDDPVYGITVTDASGERIFVSNTLWSGIKTAPLRRGSKQVVKWVIPNTFNTGEYNISPAIASRDGAVMYDSLEDAALFKVRKRLQSTGTINVDHVIEIVSNRRQP